MEIHRFYTKVFWVFDFGHFFCPIFKTGNTFVQKPPPKITCDHNALIFIFL